MILEQFQLIIEKITGHNHDTETDKDEFEKIHSVFQLPIHYTPLEYIHTLSPIVSADLELVPYVRDISGQEINNLNIIPCSQSGVQDSLDEYQDSKTPCMYEYLFKPKHDFAYNMISEWNQQYTTFTPFLTDSQIMIKNTSAYLAGINMTTTNPYIFDQEKCDKIMEVWRDTKEDPVFLEKYCYIEWDMLKHFNESSYFLQVMTIMNMTSPIMSFIIPIAFFVFPFLLLKLRGVPISFSVYVTVLKEIARNHFIGKTIGAFESMSWDKVIYVLVTLGLYFMQIYQNANMCIRFYKNIHRINTHLSEMKQYVSYSINSMNSFNQVNHDLPTYRAFCHETSHHCLKLQNLYAELDHIKPFKPSLFKFAEIGYMLKCFYRLHANKDYENSIRYSIGFEGFVNNIKGIFENLHNNHISMASFDNNSSTKFTQQYYPPYVNKEHVKNDFDLTNNAIITGPNAAGKTTMLKTTTINIIFTQQFGFGFYKECVLSPYTHIHSYLNIPDTSGRDSLFQAESRRCKEIIDIINNPKDLVVDNQEKSRHFCIFDELYSGTNPVEATQAAYAFLLYLSKHRHVDFILTTHYTELCKKLEKKVNRIEDTSEEKQDKIVNVLRNVHNYKMDIIKNPDTGKIKYTYSIKSGISKVKGAILILQEMNYPEEIIQEMRSRKHKNKKL
jgi:hypothetical protein